MVMSAGLWNAEVGGSKPPSCTIQIVPFTSATRPNSTYVVKHEAKSREEEMQLHPPPESTRISDGQAEPTAWVWILMDGASACCDRVSMAASA